MGYIRTDFISAFLSCAILSSVAFAEPSSPNATGLTPSKLRSIGSDSMGSLVRRWSEAFSSQRPALNMQVLSRGSATAPVALIDGSAELGPMSRTMKRSELIQFRTKYGFDPTQVKTSMAAVGIYVSRTNPIKQISLSELDSVFSQTYKRPGAKPMLSWSDLGAAGVFGKQKIVPIGSEADSQTSVYFRQQAILQGELREDLLEVSDRSSLIEAFKANPGGIAFADVFLKPDPEFDSQVRLIGVKRTGSAEAVFPTESHLLSGKYPLGRFLNIYVVRYPGEPVDDSVKSFLQFVLSPAGQNMVKGDGLVPLPAKVVSEELAKLE